MSVNQCTFIGNLGRDPEIRTMQNGDKLANLRLACTERFKDKNTGERKEKTEWITVVVWGPLAGVCEQHLRKGSKIYVQGKMETRRWQDQSGADKYSTEIVLRGFGSTLQMLDGPSGGSQQSGGGESQSYGGGYDYDDEIKF